MKKIVLPLFLLSTLLFAYSSNVINGYAVSIYDKNLIEENIQAIRKTKKNYNGLVYVKVYIFGKLFHENPKVKIGNSIGHIIKERSIVKNRKIIGKEITYKHHAVSKGYLELSYSKKILDTKVFVK